MKRKSEHGLESIPANCLVVFFQNRRESNKSELRSIVTDEHRVVGRSVQLANEDRTVEVAQRDGAHQQTSGNVPQVKKSLQWQTTTFVVVEHFTKVLCDDLEKDSVKLDKSWQYPTRNMRIHRAKNFKFSSYS